MNLLASYYHKVFAYPDAPLFERLLSKTGGPLVDLGCATGRVLEIAERAGYEAMGVDSSPDMIRVGQSRLGKNPKIRFVEGNFLVPQDDQLGRVGLVSIAANTFAMLLDRQDRIRALKTVSRYLNKNGRCYIHMRSDTLSEETSRESTVTLEDGRVLEFKLSWNEDLKTMIRTFEIFFKLEKQEQRFEFSTKIIPFATINQEFEEAGLEVEESFGNFDESPLRPDSVHWFFVLKKV